MTPRPIPPAPLRTGPEHDRLTTSRSLSRRVNRWLSPVAFSTTLEDPRTVETALRIAPGQRIVCLASAGDLPLALLRHGPGRVTAVDISAAQLHLTELKRHATARLSYDDLRALLLPARGPDGRAAAAGAYRLVRPHLPAGTAQFWDAHRSMIEAGVLRQGAVHRLAAAARPVWLPLADRAPHRAALLLRPGDGDTGDGLPWSGPGAQAAVAAHADRLVLAHTDLRRHLREAPAGGIDRYALSNVHDWLTPRGWTTLLREVVRTAAPGARVVAGSRRRRIAVPAGLSAHLRPDPALQHALLAADRVRYFRSLAVLTVAPAPGAAR